MSTDTKKAKALELAITQIDRQFGKGSIMKLGEEHVPTMENSCLLYTSPSPRDATLSRMPSSA